MREKEQLAKMRTYCSPRWLLGHLFQSRCFKAWPDKIAEANLKSIGFFTGFGPLVVFLCAIHNAYDLKTVMNSLLYTGCYLLYCLVIQQFAPRNATLAAYLVQLPGIVAGIAMCTWLDRVAMGYTIMIMLVVFPLFIFDKPWRLTLYSLAIVLVFTAISASIKANSLVLHELRHTLIALLTGWTANMFLLNSRIVSIEQGEYDPLTQLYNRRGAESQIQTELDAGHAGVLLMIDVDCFKAVNDNYGHEYGDKILVDVARCLQKFFRKDDIIMRYGGDEFVVFILGTMKREVLAQRLDCLCREIHDLGTFPNGTHTSISIGAVICAGCLDADYERLCRRADQQLYKAKSTGRDGFRIE